MILFEYVEIIKEEKLIFFSVCGRFEYGDIEIKSYLLFVYEMDNIKCDKSVIVNLRKGEIWVFFRDWDISWKCYLDLFDFFYRYDFVEVIIEFDDKLGILVVYMGRVEGFELVLNCVE